VPALRRVAIMGNVDYRGSELEMAEVETSAHTLGLETVGFEIRRAEDIAPAIDALKGRADALYVAGDTLVHTNRVTISNMALATRLPTISVTKALAEAGVLMSYGPNFSDMFRRAANYVDKILRGTKPGDLPIEQPTKFDLTINLKTAKALGLAILESFLQRADELIE
jgi:putative tryptophan/tyrosine transport system substrate-binding protein